MGHLTPEQLDTLEQALCSSEGLGTLERNKLKAATAKKKTAKQNRNGSTPLSHSNTMGSDEITPADDSTAEPAARAATPTRRPLSAHVQQSPSSSDQSLATPTSAQPQRRHSYNLDSRDSNATVFEPHPVGVSDDVSASSTEVSVTCEEGVVLEEAEQPFPHLGTNQPVENVLPSARLSLPTPTTSSSSSSGLGLSASSLSPPSSNQTTPPPSSPVAPSKSEKSSTRSPKRSKAKGPAGFPSVEDLMHRLFLGISGVADQLQTNHAKDLRVILKSVFTVCQSESECEDDDEELVPCQSQGSQRKCTSMSQLEPCTPEPQSPLITSSQSKPI